jgi:hypothetical protein
MSIQKLWKVKCTNVEHASDPFRYRWYPESFGTPTICVDNDTHDIETTGANKPKVEKTKDEDLVTLNEGKLTKTGQLAVQTVAFDCPGPAGTVSTGQIYWHYAVSALEMFFEVEDIHKGDLVSLTNAPIYVGETLKPVGALTASLVVPTAHIDQNYVVGDMIIYLGETYTCILDTVSNETPYDIATNELHWKCGMRLSVTSTVTENCNHGYRINITDGVTNDILGEIYDIDKDGGYIYVQNKNTITKAYSVASPTYVYATVNMMDEFELSGPWRREFGGNKIGGSDLPKNTLVTISYKNVDGVAGKRFVGEVELLRGTNITD